ncbi:MAG TPA: HAMP domain-containing sensor histidine kinase [Ktedonobacterales bacterium]|nr:HAMP domain-containing sensor histidine kinase [Ktedonobacterales bacterium]
MQNSDTLTRFSSDSPPSEYYDPQEGQAPPLAPVPPPPFHPVRTARTPISSERASTDQATVLPIAHQAPSPAARDEFRFLRQAGQAFASATSEHDIWQALASTLKEVCDFAACSILQVDATGSYQLTVIVRHPLSQRFLQQNIERLAFEVLRLGMPTVKLPQLAARQIFEATDQISSDTGANHPLAERIEAFIAHPLVCRGHMSGLLGLADERWGIFDKGHEEFLAALADYAALALENIRSRQREHPLSEQGRLAVLPEATDRQHMEKWKDDFLSSVSHELRTPLTPIKGYTQHLLRRATRRMAESASADADDQSKPTESETYEHRCLGIIQSEAEHLERLVNNLLDFSLLQRGAIQLHPTEFDLAEITRQTVQSIQVAAEQHRLTLKVWAEQTVIRADRERIRVVVGNLIDNAVKFSPNGGPVTIAILGDERELTVTVSDQGIGIAPEQFDHLFDRFYHPSALSAHQYGGIGVSLYLAQAILKLHGGRIWAESKHTPGETGAMFAFSLPGERAEARARIAHD